MSSHNEKSKDRFDLDDAVDALMRTKSDSGPDSTLIADTVDELNRLEEGSRPVLRTQRDDANRIMASSLALGVVMIISAVMFIWVTQVPTVALDDVLGKVEKIDSVQFVARLGSGDQERMTRMWLKGDLMRYQLGKNDVVMIVDGATRKGIEVHHARKVVKELDLVGVIPAEELRDPIDQLRKLKEQKDINVTRLPDEEVEGVTCHVFKLEGAKALRMEGTWTLWVDPKTNLPARMEIGENETKLTFDEFVWNKPAKASLFSLSTPRGYAIERPIEAKLAADRIYYHRGKDFYSINPDGKDQRRQFVPSTDDKGGFYASDKSVLLPGARYLAVSYSSHRSTGSHPPERIMKWDRTKPELSMDEIYFHKEVEISHWNFAKKGRLLFVAWWKKVPEKKWPNGVGAEMVTVESGARKQLVLPSYKNEKGDSVPCQFGAALPDGSAYVAIGDKLYLMSIDGKKVKELPAPQGYAIPRSARFCPDGKQLLIAAMKKDGSSLVRIDIQSGKASVVVPSGKFTDIRPRWSADGKRIAYSCRDFDPNHRMRVGKGAYLRTIDADGRNEKTVVSLSTNPNGVGIELTGWQ